MTELYEGTLQEQLEAAASVVSGWNGDSYCAVPSAKEVEMMRAFLAELEAAGTPPDEVGPDAAGGIYVCWTREPIYVWATLYERFDNVLVATTDYSSAERSPSRWYTRAEVPAAVRAALP